MGNVAKADWISRHWARISDNTRWINSCTCSNARKKCYLSIQLTIWCVVKKHMKIRVKSEDIDLHALSVLKQQSCFYSVAAI